MRKTTTTQLDDLDDLAEELITLAETHALDGRKFDPQDRERLKLFVGTTRSHLFLGPEARQAVRRDLRNAAIAFGVAVREGATFSEALSVGETPYCLAAEGSP